jgi:hypothetical protein
MEEMGHAYVFLIFSRKTCREKRSVGGWGGALLRWEDMNKRDGKDIGYEDTGWVNRPAERGLLWTWQQTSEPH